MVRSRFLWKLYAGLALVIVVTAGIVGLLLASQVERDALVETDRRLAADAVRLRELTRDLWQATDRTILARRVAGYAEVVGSRLTVIRADGTVLADSDEDPSGLDNHADRPEVVAALADGRGTANRFSQTQGAVLRYLALRDTDAEGRVLGVVRAAVPQASVRDRLGQIRRLVALGAGLGTVVALALGLVIARRTTRPLQVMTEVAEAMAAGDHSRIVTTDRKDELGVLARAFNTMSGRIGEQVDQLTLEHSKLTAVLGSLVEGVVAVDRQERVVHVNQAAADLLRVEAGAILGRPIWEVTRIREISEAILAVMETDATADREIRLPGPSDQIIELRAAPLRDGADGPSGVVLALEDVTQLRQLETMRKDFVTNVSHELKTPITAIRGLVETMIDDPDIPPATRDRFLKSTHTQTLRLSSLVSDLLSLSRLEAGGRDQAEVTDLAASVRETARGLQPVADAKRARLVVETPTDRVPVHGEPEALREAVGNLVDNAIKYAPPETPVLVTLTHDDHQATVTVTDRGPGIAAHHQARIFERFYRVDKARSRSLGGTGLGLAIVKHTARELGGSVEVESTLGAGSTFRLTLPLA